MTQSTVRFDNGYELSVVPLPWDHCVEIAVRDLGGNTVHGQRGSYRPILPIVWYPAFEQDVRAGKIVDRSSLEDFYSRMSPI